VPVPASVIEVLETKNAVYQVKARNGMVVPRLRNQSMQSAETECLVKSLVLQDAKGIVQIILPSNYIVNLAAIQNKYGRNLGCLDKHELQELLVKHDVKTVPAIPKWQDLPTLIDASLLKYQSLLLDTGGSEQILEMQVSDFQKIIEPTNITELGAPAPEVPDTSNEDTAQIFDSLRDFTQLRIKQRLEETLELPPLPETAQRIIKLRADPDADVSDLSSIVELDPSLAAQVVSWASSPYYSAPGKIKSVHDAVVRVLGFDMVLNLSLGLALGKSMNPSVMGSQQMREYWYTSVCTAAVVEGLVTSIPREHRPGFGMAYLSGLLSNFGQLVLAEVFPPYYKNLTESFRVNPHLSDAAIERHFIGVSGCQITGWLLEAWNLPAEVVTAIRYQHNPLVEIPHNEYCKLNYLATQMLANKGVNGKYFQAIDDSIYASLHLDRVTAETTVENILDSAADLEAISAQMQG